MSFQMVEHAHERKYSGGGGQHGIYIVNYKRHYLTLLQLGI